MDSTLSLCYRNAIKFEAYVPRTDICSKEENSSRGLNSPLSPCTGRKDSPLLLKKAAERPEPRLARYNIRLSLSLMCTTYQVESLTHYEMQVFLYVKATEN